MITRTSSATQLPTHLPILSPQKLLRPHHRCSTPPLTNERVVCSPVHSLAIVLDRNYLPSHYTLHSNVYCNDYRIWLEITITANADSTGRPSCAKAVWKWPSYRACGTDGYTGWRFCVAWPPSRIWKSRRGRFIPSSLV